MLIGALWGAVTKLGLVVVMIAIIIIGTSGAADSDTSMFAGFSSTCYYFGESLTDELNKNGGTAPNIGLIHTAYVAAF